MNIKLRHSIWGRLFALTFGRLLRTYVDAEIASASVEYSDPTKVLINFMWNLDATSVPDVSAFTLAGKTITNVEVIGAQITLTVSVAYVYGDSITVEYAVPILNGLIQESSGFWVNDFTQGVSNYVNTAEVGIYIGGLATPLSATQLSLLNIFVSTLKSGLSITNLSDAFDVMYILANETEESSLRNLVKRVHDATAVNSPTFAQFEGFTGGTGKWIDTDYNPATQGSNSKLNDCSYGVYIRQLPSSYSSTTYYLSSVLSSLQRLISLGPTSTNLRINSTNGGAKTMTVNFIGASRNEEETYNHFNATIYSNNAGVSTGVPNVKIYIAYNTSQQSFYFQGKSITETQKNVIVNAFEAYMDARGKGVIA